MLDPDQIYEDIWSELVRATKDRRHDFRRIVLATKSGDEISQRTVILRKVMKGDGLVIYTDSRSRKAREITEDDHVHLLLYASNKKVQLACKGRAKPYEEEGFDIRSWDPRSVKDYSTKLAPGTKIDMDAEVVYDDSQLNFAAFFVELASIEYLKLSRDGHIRLLMTRDTPDWRKSRLVP